jgi:antitoxin ParD1/3/4
MARTTSFTLGSDLEAFVREKVDSGAYSSASDVMREALSRMAEEDRKERELLSALDAGTRSRRAKPDVWNRVDAKVRRSQSKR